ncbi:hypothetical protein PG993_010788 [Apiospora rasikravindrae]|uniref:Uncharacterized protein n=1 Tax=Apiospora rasikravindrae TaxID=990691 RepID=A0ABR1SCC1_9PEZI
MTRLFNISKDFHELITDHLSAISPMSLLKCFRANEQSLSVTSTRKANAILWGKVFKDESWIRSVMDKTYPDSSFQPIPILIGANLDKVLFGTEANHELQLIVNDWGGDVQNKSFFFQCLQDHDYDPEKKVVHFKESGLRLHVVDVVQPGEMILTAKPAELFRSHDGVQATYALYYGEEHPVLIPCGGGRLSKKGRVKIEDVCTILMKDRNGKKMHISWRNPSSRKKIEPVTWIELDDRKWPTGWRYI